MHNDLHCFYQGLVKSLLSPLCLFVPFAEVCTETSFSFSKLSIFVFTIIFFLFCTFFFFYLFFKVPQKRPVWPALVNATRRLPGVLSASQSSAGL